MKSDKTAKWSALHDLALLFLSLIHGADAALDPREVAEQRERLKRWFPETEPQQIQTAMDEAMLVYVGSGRDQMVQTSVESLRQTLTSKQRVGILNDLADLASADGVLAPGEVAFIQQLATYWGYEGDDAPQVPAQGN